MKPLFLALFLLALIAGAQASETGHAYVTVRCQHNIFSNEMILTSFTENTAVREWIGPDGKWDRELAPGNYALILLDGNAGHREYRFFSVRSEETTFIDQFLGHAISTDPGRCHKECTWKRGYDTRICENGVCIPTHHPGHWECVERCE